MATKYIVDTHALIWHFEGNRLLGASAKAVTTDPKSELILPAIALAEAMFIVERGRCLLTSVRDMLDDVIADARIQIFPLTSGILEESASLTVIPEIHDRLIVATGIYLQNQGESVEILTKDNEIVLSSLLPIVW
ncbi:MAG: PIN domain-containing protein [Chloracidobacterium sp.]|nr:PIN domain-containing protein [Chloracidobacterium sp.]